MLAIPIFFLNSVEVLDWSDPFVSESNKYQLLKYFRRLIFYTFLGALSATVPSGASTPQWIRVRLSQWQGTSLKISGQITQIQGKSNHFDPISIPQSQDLTVFRQKKSWIVQTSLKNPFLVPESYLFIRGQNLFVDSNPVPPQIVLFDDGRKVHLIGLVPLEKYVTGVVAHEMPKSWPLETLKAQAVAARSYALAVAKERRNQFFDVDSDIRDQVYSYFSDQDLKQIFPRVCEAVEATEGQILKDSQGRILKTYFHSDCGGQTASAKEVWGTSEEIVSVKDDVCRGLAKSSWKLRLNKEALSRKLKQDVSFQLRPVKSDSGARMERVILKSDQGEQVWTAGDFRKALGYSQLRSTAFSVRKIGDEWLFEGRGHGHGVGLCQWGSRHWAEHGWAYRKILKHYYPKARLEEQRWDLASIKSQKTL